MSTGGEYLVQSHDQLRTALEQLHTLLVQVIRGHLEPSAARSDINAMTMRQNGWTLGAYCAQYCRVLTAHHHREHERLPAPARRRPCPRAGDRPAA